MYSSSFTDAEVIEFKKLKPELEHKKALLEQEILKSKLQVLELDEKIRLADSVNLIHNGVALQFFDYGSGSACYRIVACKDNLLKSAIIFKRIDDDKHGVKLEILDLKDPLKEDNVKVIDNIGREEAKQIGLEFLTEGKHFSY